MLISCVGLGLPDVTTRGLFYNLMEGSSTQSQRCMQTFAAALTKFSGQMVTSRCGVLQASTLPSELGLFNLGGFHHKMPETGTGSDANVYGSQNRHGQQQCPVQS